MKTQRACRVIVFQSPLSPSFCFRIVFPKKGKGRFCVCFFYLRFLMISAAAAATITMTAMPIAMAVVVGSALVGGVTAWVGEGETGVCTGVGLAGVTDG